MTNFIVLKKFGFVVTLFILTLNLTAQDLITRNDGAHIYCRIIKIDSTTITFKTPQVRDEQVIDRSLVQSYYQSSSAARPSEEPVKKDKQNPDVFLLKVSLGSCKPLAEFGSMDLNDKNAGLAKGGLATELSAIIKVSHIIGIGLGFKSQRNPFNMELLCNELKATIPNVNFQCQSEDWKMRGLFAGVHLTLPLHQPEGFWLTANLSGGIPKFVYPDATIVGEQSGNRLTLNFSSEPVSSPVFCGGLGIRYKFAKGIALDLTVDYCSAKPTFRVITTDSTGYYASESYTQVYKVVNICGGLVFCFQKNK
jgi:hypothetical protein